jgi:hypothetical protein
VYVIASFELNLYLELAISGLEQAGIARERILALPLDLGRKPGKIPDTVHYSDGLSLFDGVALLGTVFMVLGVIYGFVLKWGPILWGLIGALIGAFLGLAIDLLISHRRKGQEKEQNKRNSEVIVIVNCKKSQQQKVKNVMLDHFALGVGIWDPAGKRFPRE